MPTATTTGGGAGSGDYSPSNPPPAGWTFNDLLQSIQDTTSNPLQQAALLVGSYGESNWSTEYLNEEDPNSPGVYGAYQFTPPASWGLTPQEALDPYTATPAIFNSPSNTGYLQAAQELPSSVTNPPAQAEWIALAAEKPEYGAQEQQYIEEYNQPTTYGANYQYSVQNWATVQQYVNQMQAGQPAVTDITTSTGGTVPTITTAAITTGGTDPFTAVMIQLDKMMNRSFSSVGVLDPTGWANLAAEVLIRGGLALGFFVMGTVGVVKLATGGKIGLSDVPGMVAGFAAGPEAGLMNLLGKLGAGGAVTQRRFGQTQQMQQQRLGFAQERFGRQAELSQQRLGLAQRRFGLTERITPAREARAEAANIRAQQREARMQRGQEFTFADQPRRAGLAERAQRTAEGRLRVRQREQERRERLDAERRAQQNPFTTRPLYDPNQLRLDLE